MSRKSKSRPAESAGRIAQLRRPFWPRPMVASVLNVDQLVIRTIAKSISVEFAEAFPTWVCTEAEAIKIEKELDRIDPEGEFQIRPGRGGRRKQTRPSLDPVAASSD